MASTKAELVTRVQNITKRTDKSTVVNDALDMGLRQISYLHDWSELVSIETLSTTTDDTSATLTTGTHHIIEARVIDGTHSYKLRVIPRMQFYRLYPNVASASSSKPCLAWSDNTTLYFSAPLDSGYDIYVMSYILSTFTTSTTECPIALAENALSFYAVSFLYDSLEMFNAASVWNRRYEQAVAIAIKTDLAQPAREHIAEGFRGIPTDDYDWLNWTPDSLSV